MESETRKPFVRYSFFRVDGEWRRLSERERRVGRAQLVEAVAELGSTMDILSYSLIGTRADVDFMLWQISPSLDALQGLASRILATGMGRFLTTAYSYLAVTRPSPYTGSHRPAGHGPRDGAITPRGDDYLFVYPFTKTHEWYQLPQETRQDLMNEHFTVGHRYPGIKVHTTYSFGIDDHDFVLGFEGNDPEEFVRLVMDLRHSKARPYTLRDTPIFTCVNTPLEECLSSLG
jgi:chlorite dismutase